MTGILFVCAGNTCRSPMAEGVLKHLLDRRGLSGRITVDSAGTHARRAGRPPDPRAQQVAAEHGIDLSGLRARAVAPEDFARFDRALAMDRQNLAYLERMRPEGAVCRLDLMLSFAPGATGDDVPDPYSGGPDDYRSAFALIRQAVEGLLPEIEAPPL